MHGFKILHRDDLNKNGNSIDETTHAWLYIFLNSEFLERRNHFFWIFWDRRINVIHFSLDCDTTLKGDLVAYPEA